MKIVVVTGYFPWELMGGSEYQAYAIATGLAQRGHEVIFLAVNSGSSDQYEKHGITCIKVPGSRQIGIHAQRELLSRILSDYAPSLFYIRDFTATGSISPVCIQNRIPVISTTSSLMDVSLLLPQYPLVHQLRQLLSKERLAYLDSFLALRYSSAHVCISRFLARKVERFFPNKVVVTIYAGAYAPAPAEIHSESSHQVIWANNLKRIKRPELFIRLAHALPRYRFTMIGRMPTGRYAQELEPLL